MRFESSAFTGFTAVSSNGKTVASKTTYVGSIPTAVANLFIHYSRRFIMDFNEGMSQLSQMCKGKDWFYDIGTDSYGRYVVYVKFMSLEVLKSVPDTMAGKQVMVHFAGSKTANKEKFVNQLQTGVSVAMPVVAPPALPLDIVEEAVGPDPDEQSMRHLQNELDRLEKICGSYTLQDIFYEVQDGKNAVTNMSARYTDVRKSMEKLLDQYGFDIIYEELDG